MAFLNQQERQALLNELKGMSFNRAKGKLRTMDPKSKLVVYRNAQASGKFYTRYDLMGLGTRVTLVEREIERPIGGERNLHSSGFELTEVVVEPMPENRT